MSEKLHKAMNEQINAEMYSAYLYLSMASWLEDENLSGMAIWMKAQAQEEMEHAMKFYEFINDRRQKVDLLSIEGPKTSWNSPEEVFKESLEHEQYVTARINALMDMAREGKDYAAEAFLQWFITEQVEEESAVDAILSRMQLMGDAKHAMFMLDRELGARSPSEKGQKFRVFCEKAELRALPFLVRSYMLARLNKRSDLDERIAEY
eukprot:TRINITY_DN14964_c0_g1_i1.p2 TRINITY_DN14964_c0_g1~~TRINITY_DN14964_c0_g1_i1.p2  ORF type:complete len:230 (+),score=40.43 TRINITY_DN14964_c0_g1_i1:71-691(+)